MPYLDPYKNQNQKNDIQKKRNDSWLACSNPKAAGISGFGLVGMTVNSGKNSYHWYHCSDKILDICRPKENIGLRGMWIGCLGNPDEIYIGDISLIWVLIHGTWGPSDPFFF